MDFEAASARVVELREIIEKNNRLYYDLDAPELNDYEYDTLTQELKALEKEYPSLFLLIRPLRILGGHPLAGLKRLPIRLRWIACKMFLTKRK